MNFLSFLVEFPDSSHKKMIRISFLSVSECSKTGKINEVKSLENCKKFLIYA